MDTDRHASDGAERQDGSPPSPAPHEPAVEPTDQPTAPTGSPAHEYGYGEVPDGPTVDAAADAPADAASAAESTGSDPATGLHPATGVRGTTAPRAVLRPVPEGFPTPPPRPAVPNRRPARRPDPDATPARPRRLLIAGIAAAAVLMLVVVIGGGILALRALAPADPAPVAGGTPSAQPVTEEPAPAAAGGVLLTEVSTEVGIRAVGPPSTRLEPEGEFVVVVFEVENSTADPVQIDPEAMLEAASGAYPVDADATTAHDSDTPYYGLVGPEETSRFHAVFDVPIGTDPTAMVLEIPGLDEAVTLPLDG